MLLPGLRLDADWDGGEDGHGGEPREELGVHRGEKAVACVAGVGDGDCRGRGS